MPYMVIFRTPQGTPGYQQAGEPHDVVETVERLRNEDGVEDVRIYRMEEVAFEYKVRYTVELKDPTLVDDAAPAGIDAPDPGESLSWDDDESEVAEGATGGGAPSGPFDQMAAIDHTEAPPWGGGTEISTEPAEGSDDVAVDEVGSGARRGLFGR